MAHTPTLRSLFSTLSTAAIFSAPPSSLDTSLSCFSIKYFSFSTSLCKQGTNVQKGLSAVFPTLSQINAACVAPPHGIQSSGLAWWNVSSEPLQLTTSCMLCWLPSGLLCTYAVTWQLWPQTQTKCPPAPCPSVLFSSLQPVALHVPQRWAAAGGRGFAPGHALGQPVYVTVCDSM